MARKKVGRANGQGTVYRARDRWRWQFTVPGRDGRPGLRIGGLEDTREAAELKLIQTRADHSRGELRVGRSGPITFAEYAETYFKRPRGWAETTRHRYVVLAGYAGEYFGERPIGDLKPGDVRSFTTWLAARPSQSSRNHGQPLGLKTVSTALWLISGIFTEAVSDEVVGVNPCLTVRPPRPGRDSVEEKEAQKVFDFTQARRFVELGQAMHAAGLSPQWPALQLILSLGLRRGEAAGLRWSDVDLERRVLHVRQSVNNAGKVTAPKSRASRRSLPLPPSVVELLSGLERKKPGVFSLHGFAYPDPNGYTRAMTNLIRWSDPERFDANLKGLRQSRLITLGRELEQIILEGEALPELNVHGLRHTFATHALRRGVPVEVVSKLLGHAQISMTFNVYRHVLESEIKEQSLDLFSYATHLEDAAPALHREG